MRTVLITLSGPERTVDLVVDADTPPRLTCIKSATAGSRRRASSWWATWGSAPQTRKPPRFCWRLGSKPWGASAAGETVADIVGVDALIPGVGEVVIVGGLTVPDVAGADWVFEHPGETLHGPEDPGKWTVAAIDTAAHGIGDAGNWTHPTANHVVHDLEPWNC